MGWARADGGDTARKACLVEGREGRRGGQEKEEGGERKREERRERGQNEEECVNRLLRCPISGPVLPAFLLLRPSPLHLPSDDNPVPIPTAKATAPDPWHLSSLLWLPCVSLADRTSCSVSYQSYPSFDCAFSPCPSFRPNLLRFSRASHGPALWVILPEMFFIGSFLPYLSCMDSVLDVDMVGFDPVGLVSHHNYLISKTVRRVHRLRVFDCATLALLDHLARADVPTPHPSRRPKRIPSR
jgi:hypothetical protein